MMDAKEVLELVKHAGFNLEEPGHRGASALSIKQITQRTDRQGWRDPICVA